MYRPRRAQAHRERDASEMWPVATWQLCRNFVFSQLANRPARARDRPLIIGVQGPQGSGAYLPPNPTPPPVPLPLSLPFCVSARADCAHPPLCNAGKHSLVQRLAAELSADGYGLRVASLSIDDLVLSPSALDDVQRQDPDNALLYARGVPGTHDVRFGERVLANLRGEPEPQPRASDPQGDTHIAASRDVFLQTPELAMIPHTDAGEPGVTKVKKPRHLDVFLLEGWCLGLAPLGHAELAERYADAQAQAHQASDAGAGPAVPPYFVQYPLEHLQTIDDYLTEYAERWVSRLDAFIQLWPVVGVRSALAQGDLLRAKHPAWYLVFEWQHVAAAREGGSGSAEDAQRAAAVAEPSFLAACMPVYELWAATGRVAKLAPWSPVGPGSRGAADPWLKSNHALEWRSRPSDIPPDEERGVMPHALPERLLRIDLDKRRSVQHFTLS